MTELKLWNTLTRTKDVFTPIDPKNVRMYVCGPTVYDFAHIGNARPVIVFDVLNRLLRHLYGDKHVTYVRNITDVDDKINARALRDFGTEIAAGTMSLNEAIRKVTEPTASQYQKDTLALGCLAPDHQPRATGHIQGMIEMAQALIDKGNAYIAEGREGREVLFDVSSMPAYGKLSNRKIQEQQAGARVAVEAHKKNPGDFVLWKQSAADQPGWNAHFHSHNHTNHPLHPEEPQSGVSKDAQIQIFGRPGWHIECSVMSEAHLGKTFDIHGGGLDLIFPHHENEIAQSCCTHGTDVMANYWMHNGFLQLEGKKMSKSDGNFVTIDELLNTTKFGGRKWPGEVLRLAMLMTHYREPIDFSLGRLIEAEAMFAKWPTISPTNGQIIPTILNSLNEDLNTPLAIRYLHAQASIARTSHKEMVDFAASAHFLGLLPLSAVNSVYLTSNQFDAIKQRLAFLNAKNFAEADRIRGELAASGIQLMDYKDAETGERKTKWEVKR